MSFALSESGSKTFLPEVTYIYPGFVPRRLFGTANGRPNSEHRQPVKGRYMIDNEDDGNGCRNAKQADA
jgi:hypothetical protein